MNNQIVAKVSAVIVRKVLARTASDIRRNEKPFRPHYVRFDRNGWIAYQC